MTAQILPIDTIVRDPEVRGGSPVVSGTSVRVSDLAAYHVFDGLSPEQLAVQFDLELAQVHAVLAYYFSHRSEIDEEIRANAEAAERWRIELGEGDRRRVG
jgi:uncharacterized protein (DUF433 family)